MFNLNHLLSRLLYTTVRIIAHGDGGTSVGTSFFFDFTLDDQHILSVLITNKHVIKGSRLGTIVIHEAVTNENGESLPGNQSLALNIDGFEDLWIDHPDVSVDLCAILVGNILEIARHRGKTLFYKSINESFLPDDNLLNDLAALEDIVMVGYPNGLWDNTNNFPIMHKGVTASHPNSEILSK